VSGFEKTSEKPTWIVPEIKSEQPFNEPRQVINIPKEASNNIVLTRKEFPHIKVPPDFLTQLAVIIKDSGADSMSQRKALEKVNELIVEFKKEEKK
jgi:hypothetical protein